MGLETQSVCFPDFERDSGDNLTKKIKIPVSRKSFQGDENGTTTQALIR